MVYRLYSFIIYDTSEMKKLINFDNQDSKSDVALSDITYS